ncbi:beta strand repeat-containing protein [Kineosporia babensis]|uniref:IPT/TIG domain-containing protein n=1 Tax=Kineosporia babensis TaxID=499548 RepID=A0A9X1SS33_9ACTN|nr:IPT/TIG domain-containing protein [Kineosporia babensis]
MKKSATDDKDKKDSRLSKKTIRAAADGSTGALAYGVKTTVSLLGAPLVNVNETPKSAWPAGPPQATTANIGVPNLLSTGEVTTTAEGDDLKDTSKATSSVAGLGTGTGLQGLQGVTADVIGSTCIGTAAGVTATSTVTGLKLAGVANTTIPTNPAPNTVLDIAIGKLHLNEQTKSTAGGKTTLVTNALRLELLGGALSAVGTGDVIAGHTECTTTDALVPTLTGIAPTTGPTTGGTSVVLTGTNFRGTSSVKFGSTEAAYTIDSTTKITAFSPAGSGAQNVTVTTPGTTGGTNTGTNNFTYVGAPTVTGVAPSNGPPGGTTSVTITGTGFSGTGVGTPTVKFGNTNATGVTVNSANSITANAPAGTGTVFVTVTTNAGTSAQGTANQYTYQDALALTSIAPTSGPITGGTTVTATGTGFTADSVIQFGTTALSTTYVSDTKLTAVSPAGTGTANVTVKRGTQPATSPQVFTYNAVPVVTGLSVATGPDTGGTTVTVNGTGLADVTNVTIGGNSATPSNVTATSLQFTTPAHAAGAVTVSLTSPSGTAPAGVFLYTSTAAPSAIIVTGLAPSSGPLAGGGSATLTGTFLTAGNTVTIGGKNAPVTNEVPGALTGTITVTVPQGDAPGAAPVVVSNGGSSSLISLANTYTYTAATPTVGSLSPTNGPSTGGTEVTVTGTGFTSGSVIYWGAIPMVTTYVDGTTLKFTTPPGTGTNTVTVRTNGGTASNGATFTSNAIPVVLTINPLTGPVTGGTTVNVTGSNLTAISTIQVGSKTVNKNSGGSAGAFSFDTPSNSAGASLITFNVSGGGTALTPGTFVYTPIAAGAATVNPTSGPIQGGNQVTITGTGFSSLLALTVGGKVVPASDYTVTGDTTLTFTMPSGLISGTVPVIIATAGGIVTVNYTYSAFDSALILGISPITGPTTGGTQVTITGTGFTGATGATFGGTPGTGFNVNAAGTQVTVTTPAKAAGLVNVALTNGSAASTSTALFTYLAANLGPVVTGLTPALGSVAGGNQVTISGSGFLLATGVTFGGTAATITSLINTNTIVVNAPAHAVGEVDVVVTTPVGSSSVSADSKYTYVAANGVPVVDTMTPRSGPTGGGTTVVFRGLGMTGVNRVTFDGTAATDLTVVDNTTLTLKTPAHTAGGVPVILTNANGASRSYLFTYVPLSGLPTVSGLTPNVGPVAGGTVVTISGTGFDSATTVSFDGVEGTDLELGVDIDGPGTALETSGDVSQAVTKDAGLKAVAYKPALAKRAVGEIKAAASNTLKVTTPPHAGGPTTVVVTNSAGSISFLQSFTFIPVLAATSTINTQVEVGASKRITPRGPSYSGIEVTDCTTPEGQGSVRISDDEKTCLYTAPDDEGDDSFVMSVIDDLGQTAEQTVNVEIVAEGGTDLGDGGGNDSGDGDDGGTDLGDGGGNSSGDGDDGGTGSGGEGGNDTGSGLAFTGTPLLLIPGLALGLVLVLIGAGLLGAERFRIRRGGSLREPATDEDGRQLMPAGLFGPQSQDQDRLRDEDGPKPSPDDAA